MQRRPSPKTQEVSLISMSLWGSVVDRGMAGRAGVHREGWAEAPLVQILPGFFHSKQEPQPIGGQMRLVGLEVLFMFSGLQSLLPLRPPGCNMTSQHARPWGFELALHQIHPLLQEGENPSHSAAASAGVRLSRTHQTAQVSLVKVLQENH